MPPRKVAKREKKTRGKGSSGSGDGGGKGNGKKKDKKRSQSKDDKKGGRGNSKDRERSKSWDKNKDRDTGDVEGCKLHLRGKCKAGKNCTRKPNPPCRFFQMQEGKGLCLPSSPTQRSGGERR